MSYETELASERSGRVAAEAEIQLLRAQLAETKRRSTEGEALADSLQSLAHGRGEFIQHLVQAVPTALYIRHLSSSPDVFLNERLPQALGYTPAELRALYATPLLNLRHPADAPGAEEHHGRLASAPAEAALETEFRLQTKQGEWKWFRAVETVFARDAQGTVVQVLGSAEDISVQRAAGERLASQKEFYETVLRSLPTSIVVFDSNHRLLSDFGAEGSRQEGASWVGQTETTYGRHNGVSPALRRLRRLKFREAVRRRTPVRWEEAHESAAGAAPTYYLQHYHPVLDAEGAVRFVIGYDPDITQLKQTEGLLENQREFVRQVIENSPNPVHVLDDQGQVILANSAFEQLPVRLVQQAEPSTGAATGDGFKELLRYVEKRELPDGQAVWYQTMRKPFVRPDGSRYLLSISNDITALKQAQAAAEELARARELFVATTSHEIRTPLHGIMGLAQMLRKTPLSGTQADFVDLMLSNTNNLLFVLNDILDFAKAEAGRLDFESIPFEVGRIVQEAADLLMFRAADKGLNLDVDLGPAAGLVVEGDPYRLRQVLLNLLGNALKFTPKGRVRVAVEEVVLLGALTHISFSVQDSGIGIGPDRFETIFESFHQASSNTSRLYGGTGLGLTICKNLVELQGGQIGVESREGEGSRFYFTIPYLTSTKAAAPGLLALPVPTEPNESVLRGRKVLLAEDNPINQLIALTMLDSWEVAVDVVSNGEEALRNASAKAYDLILMDLQMPVLGGLEATAQLRANPGTRSVVPYLRLTRVSKI